MVFRNRNSHNDKVEREGNPESDGYVNPKFPYVDPDGNPRDKSPNPYDDHEDDEE